MHRVRKGIIAALSLLWAMLIVGPAQAEKKVALLIGNSAYEYSTQLGSPLNDVDAMKERLEALGFTVQTLRNVDRRTMGLALISFSEKARAAETVLIYYSGHGMEIRGRNYLIPVDAELAREAHAGVEAIDLEDIRSAAGLASKLSIVILDACRNNTFPSTTMSGAKSFVPVNTRAGQVVAFSTAPGTVAYASDGLSPYTRALTEALATRADQDVRILLSSLGAATTRYAGTEQRPVATLGDMPGDVVTLAEPGPKPDRPLDKPVTTGTRVNEAREALADAERSGDPAVLEVVAEQYPDTIWGQMAAARAASLRKQATREAVTAIPTLSVTPAPTPEPSSDSAASEAWASLQGSRDAEALRALISSYPDAPERDAANAALIAVYRAGQTELQRLGLYTSRIDGDWGGGSQRAMRRFQAASGLAEDGVLTEAGLGLLESADPKDFKGRFTDGQRFRDCSDCPEMVVIPGGSFTMGSPEDEPDRDGDEGPRHRVTLERFALGRTEVTRGAFARFVRETGHDTGDACWTYQEGGWKESSGRSWRNPGFSQTDDHPVVCVSWEDAQAYTAWLSEKAGEDYRLPSEAEQEFAARGRTEAAYLWGTDKNAGCGWANGADQAGKKTFGWGSTVSTCDDGYATTAPVGSFRANRFDVVDVIGNVWEWGQDCWNGSYEGAPRDGAAWMSGDCSGAVLRGGSWDYHPRLLRSANRLWALRDFRSYNYGFRVARTLNP